MGNELRRLGGPVQGSPGHSPAGAEPCILKVFLLLFFGHAKQCPGITAGRTLWGAGYGTGVDVNKAGYLTTVLSLWPPGL